MKCIYCGNDADGCWYPNVCIPCSNGGLRAVLMKGTVVVTADAYAHVMERLYGADDTAGRRAARVLRGADLEEVAALLVTLNKAINS